jgi:ribosomal protein L44E
MTTVKRNVYCMFCVEYTEQLIEQIANEGSPKIKLKHTCNECEREVIHEVGYSKWSRVVRGKYEVHEIH